ncbi:MAG: cysteine--tRNA ligase, partial [Chloroflexi bacterium]|nr:cysteine--tRNA ligase [Chloroflexota bacterium]
MLKLYNTLTRRNEEIEPVEPGVVKIYTCGPTVYRDAHIGNLRSYLMADWIRRALEAQGLAVRQIKNITDVGHMRQEMLEQGEDKVIAAALAEGKTPAEIAQFYTERFLRDEAKLDIKPADGFPKATDHIQEMLDIVEDLLQKGLAYEVAGNVYFDVSRFPDYGKLSGNMQDAQLMEAVRVEADPLKRDPRDFTLWKSAEEGRAVKWDSPWGDGFPGWHIECSAMSIKYLSERFDIHTGGVDNIFPHHEGEIAQSEGYTGKPVVSVWVHGQHLLADGVKMAKSAGNSFILDDIERQAIEPMAFRYLCLTTRYQRRLNFTFTSLKAAQRALLRLRNMAWTWSLLPPLKNGSGEAVEQWQSRFMEAVNENLNMPGALALAWELARSDLPGQTKLQIIREFDKVLGLDIERG